MAQLDFDFASFAQPVRPAPATGRIERAKRPYELQLDLAFLAEDEPAWFAEQRQASPRARLEEALCQALGSKVVLWLTDNASTMISARKRGDTIHARVHQLFVDAPGDVLKALASYLAEERPRPEDQATLKKYVESYRGVLNEALYRRLRIEPLGEYHDLARILDRVNREYFEGKINAQITWSNAPRGKRRATITLGTYAHELRLIRVHPALDQPFVPEYFLEYVVFHEALHQVHPQTEADRRDVHSESFMADERRFRRYHEAKAWETRNITKLLRF
ncbi:MAG: hypothetical protein HY791_26305 [Deltaproteobacteria bacterium]|nr:hypothetical protein [Deltaproteobacteria bacterium]